ncbi:hypothetical protein [Dactylosporangium sp. NPDC005555]|uniref:hypothetical protein n=1 Tax=Dactylosporangium sp. NPDC005555 TaxID=3154889 RepID=UPI0033A610A2
MASTTPPLLRELIHIPERSSQSDFVLKLVEGVTDPQATLREYVITDRLVDNFDQALNLIAGALGGGSKAAYLHGSFGAGKSHFMAVLHALLRGEKVARERDEFARLLGKHDEWLSGKNFLLVPFHLIGAKSLEQKVLGGYVEHIRRLHPDAPIPAVHRTDALLESARYQRKTMGDPAFISGLPGSDDEWGDEEAWTSQQLDAAFAASPDDEGRQKLVNDLLQTWNQGFFTNAQEDAEGFVSLDRGLTEISRHAKSLGYDGLVLFLDELILWLANSIADEKFVAREIQKITNFVEGGDVRRPIPIVSFIARQRDLRELVGTDVTGATELGFMDTLNLASGRFELITLEDRNLPDIARQRLLKPLSDEGDRQIADAFERTTKEVRRDVFDTLMGAEGADLPSFRATYPFSPAFISTLVHVSSALQRSRTALKLMRDLLVERRDDLRLGQLVPLGDLYEVISRGGDQPFTEKLKIEFETAQRLYQGRLRPYLLNVYGIGEDDVERVRRGGDVPADLAGRVRVFTGDDRIIKTLLLSALAPTVPALRNLTARRLSALNHGSITSPIPGGEVGQVMRKIDDWAGQFGEIKKLGIDDPVVSLELVGVDVDSVLQSAHHFDKPGNRRLMVKRLLWEELGVTESGQYVDTAELPWRGSRRQIEMIYGNVRDENNIRDDAFHPLEGDAWRLIIDYPFDEGNHSPADDRDRVHRLAERISPRTVCWIPAAFTADRLNDLGRLVIIDAVLSGQRFDSHAQHLSKDDRRRANDTLRSQRDALMSRMRTLLRQAYGLAAKQSNDVVTSYQDHVLSLASNLQPTLPIGAAFKQALQALAEQMLASQFPAHPDFDPDRNGTIVRSTELKMVLEVVRQAIDAPDGRVEVERKDRLTVRRIANPLRLGEMHESAFVLGRHWVQHFHQKVAQEAITGDLKVPDLLRWLDEPQPYGLDRSVAGLVLMCFAEQTDRAWLLQGGVLNPPPDLTGIRDHFTLREQALPSEEHWQTAVRRSMDLFGVTTPGPRRGRLVALLVRDISSEAGRYRNDAHRLLRQLQDHAQPLDLSAETGRLQTAQAAADLLDGLHSRASTVDVITHLATADLGGPADRCGVSIRSAATIAQALDQMDWSNLELITQLPAPFDREGAEILEELRTVARSDELTTRIKLAPALTTAKTKTSVLLKRAIIKPTPPPTPPPPPPNRTATRRDDVTAANVAAVVDELRQIINSKPDKRFTVTWEETE